MIVADYITNFIYRKSVDTFFAFPGGGNMYLIDSLEKSKDKIRTVFMLHEQALSFAVNGYARMRGWGAVYVTSGPGALNCIPGVAEAYVASVPCIFVSGQTPIETCVFKDRSLGVQQVDIISLVTPITCYAAIIRDSREVKFHLEAAFRKSTENRGGPVWLDIPLDIQNKEMWEDDNVSVSESI